MGLVQTILLRLRDELTMIALAINSTNTYTQEIGTIGLITSHQSNTDITGHEVYDGTFLQLTNSFSYFSLKDDLHKNSKRIQATSSTKKTI